ncbi:probable G-protein coupled receptor 139 [Scyliorhinus torazame]|uniref:probable G-protein coupled receptor 139 n=1 Tax=Scyliorhinus torazame TaxID=75743 RepID=UPI003B5C882B
MLVAFSSVDKIFYTFLAAIGIPVDLLAILILSRGKCGLSSCTTRYLLAMALSDLFVIITEVILMQINHYYFPICFLDITPICSVNAVLRGAAIDCSVWFTITFSFDRFVAICCQKLNAKYCTVKTAAVVLATFCIFLCFANIPIYFTYEPESITDNVSWFCHTKPDFYSETGWVRYNWFDRFLTPLLPFALIVLINALTVRHILVASRVRKGLKGIDPNDYTEAEYIFQQVGIMLRNLSCCTNTFIYAATQSKFRGKIKATLSFLVP